MKPTINSNRICEILRDDSRVWLSWHCITISRFPTNFQDPNGHLLNTVPPEVIKAGNKIVKQASNKGGILKAQQRKYSVSRLQSNASSNSSVGVGISLWIWCYFTARDRHLGLVRVKVNAHSLLIIFNECAFSSIRAVKKFLVVGMCTKIKPSKFSSPAFLQKFCLRNLPIIRYHIS